MCHCVAGHFPLSVRKDPCIARRHRHEINVTMSSSNMLERRKKDEQVRATIHQKLIDTGEKDRLKNLLRAKLEECGWRDELKNYCKEVIKNKGLEKITVEELVAEIAPRGRATVPAAIKAELLQRIRKFLTQN